MVKLFELDQEQLDWIDSRPDCVKETISKIPSNLLYRLKSTGQRCYIYSYFEDGTVKIAVPEEINEDVLGVYKNVTVFGIRPEDLEECDLPDYFKATMEA